MQYPYSLPGYLAEYMGMPAPDGTLRILKPFLCPGWVNYNLKSVDPNNPLSLATNVMYKVSVNTDLYTTTNRPNPFGYSTPGSLSSKLSTVTGWYSPSSYWWLTDVDALNGAAWSYEGLPAQPVHGSVRVYNFFDWHIETIKVGASTQMK